MEIRVLEYYIAIVEAKNITRASELLFISQSTLSRQIMDLEKELNVKLFKRGKKEITLTEDGEYLYPRAKEIIQLTSDTERNITSGNSLSGTLRIGIGEGDVNELVLAAVKKLMDNNKSVNVDYRTLSADKIYHQIDLGLLDFGIIWTNDNVSKYDSLSLHYSNYWGVVINKNHPLANKSEIVASDLRHQNLIIPQQLDVISDLQRYLNEYVSGARITGYYDMNYNMIAMVKANIGIAITLNKPEYENSNDVVFIPLKALGSIKVKLIWKSNTKLTRLNQAYIEMITKLKRNN